MIRASGGLIVRDGRVVVVHRSEYDDWSFPKGKAKQGESDEDCALREIEEETGMRCELREELPSTRHLDAEGRPKRVRWWTMSYVSGAFTPTDEIDGLRWATPEEARRVLSYARDLELLEEVL